MQTKEYTYRFRIYPNKKQEDFLQKSIGCNRFIYNFFLERAINLYENYGIKFNYYEAADKLKLVKKGFSFLKEVNSQSLQASLGDLKIAYERFFKKKSKFPKFKKKSDFNAIVVPQFTPAEYALVGNQSIGSSYHTKKQEAHQFKGSSLSLSCRYF